MLRLVNEEKVKFPEMIGRMDDDFISKKVLNADYRVKWLHTLCQTRVMTENIELTLDNLRLAADELFGIS